MLRLSDLFINIYQTFQSSPLSPLCQIRGLQPRSAVPDSSSNEEALLPIREGAARRLEGHGNTVGEGMDP